MIDPDGGPPVPLWKVHVPAHIQQPSTPREPLSGYLTRRAEELNLDLSRTPQGSHAIWHMLTRNQEFAPRGATFRLAA